MPTAPENRPDQDERAPKEPGARSDARRGDGDEESKGGPRRSGDMRRADTTNGEGPDAEA